MNDSRGTQSGVGASEHPRYASLQDYMRVLRRYRLMIALVVVGFLAGGFLIAAVQATTYEAEAALSFRDVTQDLNVVGISGVPEQPAAVRAASNAELATRPDVTRRVKRDLDTSLTTQELQDAVTASVRPQTQLVIIQAKSTDAAFAAKLANAYADEVKTAGTRDVQQRLRHVEKAIAGDVSKLTKSSDPTVRIQIVSLRQQLSRVQTLKEIAEPVKIAERAQVPTSPASPQTGRDIALGGVVGIVFALLIAFIRDSLDRRLYTVHEVHEELGIPVLGRVSNTALGFPGLARNGRMAMNEADFESFRVLRMNLGALGTEHPPRSLVVTSGLPEEGKSTVSMSLASAVALAGQSVLLVECDLRRPSFATRLGIDREPGLSDYLLGRAAPQDVLQTVDLSAPVTNGVRPRELEPPGAMLVCITAGTAVGNPAELLITARFRDFLEKVTKAYDLVILDTSPLLSVADPLELVPHVDGVILCVRVQQATREEARATRAALSNLPNRPIGAVVTGLRRGGSDTYDYYSYGD